jgi:hypothetical protein
MVTQKTPKREKKVFQFNTNIRQSHVNYKKRIDGFGTARGYGVNGSGESRYKESDASRCLCEPEVGLACLDRHTSVAVEILFASGALRSVLCDLLLRTRL